MRKMAVLGPKGTYSDIVALKYKFYIECNLIKEKLKDLKTLVDKLNNIYIVNLLGAYNEI